MQELFPSQFTYTHKNLNFSSFIFLYDNIYNIPNLRKRIIHFSVPCNAYILLLLNEQNIYNKTSFADQQWTQIQLSL